MRKLTVRKRARPTTGGRVSRLDPSRTVTLRRQWQTDISRRFDALRRELVELVVEEDALGLKRRSVFNESYFASCRRDAKGHCLPSDRVKMIGSPHAPTYSPMTVAEKSDSANRAFSYSPGFTKVSKVKLANGKSARVTLKNADRLEDGSAYYVDKKGRTFYQQPGSVLQDRPIVEIAGEQVEKAKSAYADKLDETRRSIHASQQKFDAPAKMLADKIAEQTGLSVSLHHPEDSNSRYVYVDLPAGGQFKIRFADHPQPVSWVGDKVGKVGGFDTSAGVRHSASDVSIDPDTEDTPESAMAGLLRLMKSGRPGQVHNTRWQFHTAEGKVQSFLQWLKARVLKHLVDEHLDEQSWWHRYIVDGWKRGVARAFDDSRPQVREWQDSPEARQRMDFYNGTREEFLRSSFNHPVSKEKVRLLASRTFTDLKGTTDQMAARISHALVDGLTKGDNPRVIARELARHVDVGKTRAQTIARTEIIRVHAEGQLDAFERMGVTELGVMAEWSTAEDARVCKLCRPLDGIVLKVEEAHGLLPRHPNCLPGDCLVLPRSRIAAASERWYDGDLVVFRTASGRELSCTPNHPILTDQGWLPAHSLQLGSNVVCDGGREWEPALDHDEDDQVPSSIQDVASAFGESGEVSTSEVPLTPPDFHGDAADGQVAVIRADRRLLLGREFPLPQQSSQFDLNRRDIVSANSLLGHSVGNLVGERLGDSTDSLVGGRSLSQAGSRVHESPLVRLSLGLVTQADVPVSQASINPPTANPQFQRELVRGLPADVFIDHVVHIDHCPVSCHVYNLQTENGWYSASGIITHNCRCAFVPANVGEDESQQKRTKGSIQRAIDESYKAEAGKRSLEEQVRRSSWGAADKTISKARPKGVFNVDDELGRWITVKGQHVFIPEGKDTGEAIKQHFEELKDKKEKKPAQPPKPKAVKQTETPEFKKWFGDSKVVDEKGEPLVVYHGTIAEFDIFKDKLAPEGAHFFSDNPESAGTYAAGVGRIIPAYLALKNPYYDDGHTSYQWIKNHPAKYDGVIRKSPYGKSVPGNFYAVFSSTQIKSASGNRGTFDPDDPIITHRGHTS